jgi:nudix-type nucleoside diphosphatase (YffH/AdpP family)
MAEIVRSRVLHQGWSTFRLIDVRLDDGDVVERAVEDHGDGVIVLPYDPERRTALLVRQLRAPALFRGDGAFLEPPAGMLEDGEAPEACARREALEEAGVRLGALEPLGRYWATPGSSTEKSFLFLAPYSAGDRTGAGGGADAHEHLEVLEIPLPDLAAALDRGELQDLKLMALLLSLIRRRPELFR